MGDNLLLTHFEQMVSRAEDVPKLNEVILQLAVQGKLAAQDPHDEPAAELLKRIQAEKKRLVQEKKIKKSKPLPEIEKGERPFSIPDNWLWVRLPEIYSSIGQKKPDKTFTYIDVSSIDNVNGRISDELSIIAAKDAPSRARKLVKNGTVIYSTVRPYLLNIAIVDREFEPEPIVSTAFAVMHPFAGVYNKFLYYYLRSKPFVEFVESQMTGMAYPAISDSKLNKGLFPLPPFAEQKRIVERVDTLLAQTRQLESQMATAVTTLSRLHGTAVQTLLSSTDADEFTANWQFIADNFDTFYDETYPEAALANVAELKQAILQLAVQGKLTRQDPADEPASELLQRIAAEKKRLGIKSKKLPEIGEGERPYALPDGWQWVRLDQLMLGIKAGKSPKAQSVPANYGEYGVLKVSAVTWGKFQPEENKALLPGTPIDGVPHVKAEDFLISRANTAQLVGAVVLVKEDHPNLLLSDKTLRIDFASDVHKPFMIYALRAPWVRDVFESGAIGTSSSMRNISQNKIRSAPIALPPLAEQKRIVTRVNTLLRLCDNLAVHLRQAQATNTALHDAVLEESLAVKP